MATGIILPPIWLQCSTTYGALVDAASNSSQPSSGKVRSYTIRATNYGVADGYVWLILTNGTNTIQRVTQLLVPIQSKDSAINLEDKMLIPAGWHFEAKASATATIEVSGTGVEDDA